MKTMKLVTTLFLAMGLLFVACEKEGPIGPIGPAGSQGLAGEQGPAGTDGADGIDGTDGTDGVDGADGADGEQGPQGPKGDNGQDGNANVTQFTFPSFDHPGGDLVRTITLSRSDMEESLILVYVQVGILWYQVPGNTGFGYEYRLLYNPKPSETDIIMRRTLGSGNQSFNGMRILVIPANQIITAKNQSLNFNKMTYEEVMDYFGMEY